MGLLDKIFDPTSGAARLLDSLTKGVDTFVTTKAETEAQRLAAQKLKAEIAEGVRAWQLEVVRQVNEYERERLRDVADARAANVALQSTTASSWLAKNVGYVLDVVLAAIWGACTVYLIGRALHLVSDGDHDLSSVLAIYSTVTGAFTVSLTFHRGSSQGSANAGQFQRQLLDKLASTGSTGEVTAPPPPAPAPAPPAGPPPATEAELAAVEDRVRQGDLAAWWSLAASRTLTGPQLERLRAAANAAPRTP